MTIEELIKKYQKELEQSKDKKGAVCVIIDKINELTYAKSNLPISIEDKQRILEGLRRGALLECEKNFAYDNKEHLSLIDKTIATLGRNK